MKYLENFKKKQVFKKSEFTIIKIVYFIAIMFFLYFIICQIAYWLGYLIGYLQN